MIVIRSATPLRSRSGQRCRNNSLIEIGTLDGDVNSVTIPAGINRARQIVGTGWKNGNSEQRAFLWENGVFDELPLLQPPAGYDLHYSAAAAINNAATSSVCPMRRCSCIATAC
jgi:probable HAF family extracellular repeat protein